ncbi:S9 family peptidase [Gallaecimonas mangrovi]|uniref:S9 family peptidase n=1 Tax=Gallaecimonas mangrovi TaxID=2291597 RepID=UPI000E207EC4|nr:S9 family peptidase [Gallaecimonas mangrovi]
MRSLLLFVVSSLMLAGCHGDKPASYDANAFFDSVNYQNLSLSEDGKQALVSSDKNGVFNVHAINVADGTDKALTQSQQSTYAVSWFPGDNRFLFTRDKGGNEIYHLYVDDDAGQHDLIPDPNARAEFLAFSQDGRSFYVLSNERDPNVMDLYRYDASSYQRQRIFDNTQAFAISSISGNGRFLALSRINNNADSDLYLVDLESADKTPQLIGDLPGEKANFNALTFGPYNHYLYFATDAFSNFKQVWSHHLLTGNQEQVASDHWDISHFSFSHSGRYRIQSFNEDGHSRLEIYQRFTGKRLQLPALPKGDISDVTFSNDDKTLLFYLDSDTSPADLYALDLPSGKLRQLTHALGAGIDKNRLVAAKVVRFQSTDNLTIPALLYKPQTASSSDKVPMVLWLHGGPGGQSRHGYNAVIQYLVNHGYGVLAVNNRGSSGYGKPFFHLDDKQHGEGDLADVVSARDYVKTLPWADGEHVAVMGGSYGGYLAVAALAFHPDTFSAGIDLFGVTNWVRTLASIPPWWQSYKAYLYSEMGDPVADKARLERISPLFHTDNITKPLLVLQGMNDPRVLPVESQQLVAALKKRKVAVQYLTFADEGHGFTKKANRIKAAKAYLDFLNKHVKPHNWF